jgi:hypothetical protein
MPLPDSLNDDFRRFAFTADEWLTSYAHLSSTFVVVYPTTFSMAMVLELYLKAYSAFLSGNGTDVTKFGHKIAELYEDLQTRDSEFPFDLRLSPSLSKHPLHNLDAESWQCSWYSALSQTEQDDIRANYEIYLVMGYAADLKYGISPALPRHNGRIISSAWSRLNPWLARFVCRIRKRIGYPANMQDDRLFYSLRHPELHQDARTYLANIHETFNSGSD